MRRAKEIAEVFVTGIFQKTPGHWANRFTVENAIKRAQIEALEWAARETENASQTYGQCPGVDTALKASAKILEQITELKGEK